MDQTNQHNLSFLKQFPKFHFPRKAIPILLIISLFSLLFSFSSYFSFSSFFSLSYSYILFLHSTFSIKELLSYSTDIKYIFLLCNGILVVLITKSGLMRKSKSPLPNESKENRIGEFRREELELSVRKHTEAALEVEKKEEEEEEEQQQQQQQKQKQEEEEEEEEEQQQQQGEEEEEEEEEQQQQHGQEEEEEEEQKQQQQLEQEEEEETKEYGILVTVNNGDEGQEQIKKFHDAAEEEKEKEEEEEEEEERGIRCSLEELNSKCDDFIKMMREGIKIKIQAK